MAPIGTSRRDSLVSYSPLQTNLKKCMDYIQHRSVEKIVKMLDRGLDPNFHDLETGGESGLGDLPWA